MKIGLIGFEFQSANKGCEALVYSFLSVLGKIIDKDLIVYNFSGTDLGVVPSFFSKMEFVNVCPKIKDFSFKYIRKIKECDVIFDVTMGDSFSDIYSKEYYDSLIRHKRVIEMFCDNYVLLPQTYGPFNASDSTKKAKKILKKAFKIFCRDEMSLEVLRKSFGITVAILVSDMAFVLPYDKFLYRLSKKDKIGLNVSGLLYRGGFIKKNQFNLTLNYPVLIDNLIKTFSEQFEIHLIAHVIDMKENAYDDDYQICKKLHEKYPNTVLAPIFDTPIEAKSYISNMNYFIGSRMHSTIAAFSSGVLTIPISYSRKFEGLFGSLKYPYVIDAKKETTKSAEQLVIRYIGECENISNVQQKSMKLIEEKNNRFEAAIKEIIGGIRVEF